MASSDADLKTVKDDLNQLRADVRSLAETMQTTAKDRAASAKTRVKEGVDQGKDQLMAAEQKAEQQIADAFCILPHDTRRAAGLQFLDSMQRKPDRMFERPLPHGHANQHGDSRRVPPTEDVRTHFEKRQQQHASDHRDQ